jgi:hypothetical protein
MMKRTRILALVAVLTLLWSSVQVLAQTSIGIGDTVTGTAPDTVDYTLDLEEGQTVSIALESEDFDTLIEVRDSSDAVIESDDDGGEGLNSLLLFEAPAADTYTLTVSSFGGSPGGEYTLSVTESDIEAEFDGGTLAAGEPVTIESPGAPVIRFEFDGTQGMVVNLFAESSDDTFITVDDPFGEQIARDDDSGGSLNPYIRRLLLPSDGTYQVNIEDFSDEPIMNPVTVTLEETEPLEILDADPVTISLTNSAVEAINLDASAGQAYRLTLMDMDENSLSLDVIQQERNIASSFTSGMSEMSVVFTTPEDGLTRIMIDLALNAEFTVSLETVE